MAIDPAGFGKVKWKLTDVDGSVYPGMEFFATGTPTLAQMDDAAAQILSAWIDLFQTQFNPAWLFERLTLEMSNGVSIDVGTASSATTGSYSGTQPVRSLCVVTGYKIESFYRGGKPRSYWPAFSTSALRGTTRWDGGTVGGFVTKMQSFIDAINGGAPPTGFDTFTLGCIRRRAAGLPLAPPVFYAYTGTHGDTRVCTQRRRLGRL